MAKSKKDARIKIGLVCEMCKTFNYITEKNRLETKEKIKLQKYCKRCKKHTLHVETQKLGKNK
jgi:large subunit ribosomal protein L33